MANRYNSPYFLGDLAYFSQSNRNCQCLLCDIIPVPTTKSQRVVNLELLLSLVAIPTCVSKGIFKLPVFIELKMQNGALEILDSVGILS